MTYRKADSLRHKAERKLAADRGWQWSKYGCLFLGHLVSGTTRGGRYLDRYLDTFDTFSLGIESRYTIIDHAACFRCMRKPAALLSYSYETDRDKHVELAKRTGLAVEFLDESWYGHGTLAALYIRM